ncbi:isoprenylcysteine carboxylmethyltransferase family protein [Acidocella sp.]|uniref:methyltransferase family protein n=2 Tax=Acidocella sp. TaxID=50710 RepID=UPI00260C5197|nr:methyltransferase [Acidocella sp.]
MHTILTIVTGLDATACFAAFVWGVKAHFRSTGDMPLGMKLTSGLSTALFVAFLWHMHAGTSNFWLLAVVLFTAAFAVFAAAIVASRKTPPTLAYDTDSPSFLLNAGPYRYVRHPFYLAYVLFWFGTAIATNGLAGWLAPAIMTTLYLHAATREERKFANSELAAAYAAYRTRAGLFWPRPRGIIAG